MEINILFPRNDNDQKISELNKQATQYSSSDINKAIECLEVVWELIPNAMMNYGAKGYVRLPKFLQQAGRFDEAKQKFNELILLADYHAEQASKTHDLKEFYCPFCKELFLSEVYDAMRIVYKREKLMEDVEHFKKLSEFHYQESQKYGEQLDGARKKQLDQHRKKFHEKNEEPDSFRWTSKF